MQEDAGCKTRDLTRRPVSPANADQVSRIRTPLATQSGTLALQDAGLGMTLLCARLHHRLVRLATTEVGKNHDERYQTKENQCRLKLCSHLGQTDGGPASAAWAGSKNTSKNWWAVLRLINISMAFCTLG